MCAGELLDIIGGQFIDPANVDFFVQGLLGEGIDQVFWWRRVLFRDDHICDQQSHHSRGEWI
jgi:hypothetical protein